MDRIAKYELREVLGRGGMGVVYRAYDPVMDREIALKIILETALDLPDVRSRFIREARTAGRLAHENIGVIYDLGEFEGKTYIAMEYLPGRDLRSIIDAREPLSLPDKLELARQILRGLQYAHAHGVVHRDIKPENIKVVPDGRVKILDFGIAKPYLEASAAAAGADVALTGAGIRIGTPWYMSPEQVKGLPVDRRSDIFSFGVLLYELVAYTKPFRGDDTTVLYKIVHEEPEPLQLSGAPWGDTLQRIVRRCLAKEPADRYEDCQVLLRDIAAVADAPVQTETAGRLQKETRELEHEQDAFLKKLLPGNIIGETISHFRILERIGGGGVGVVYKAEDLALKRTVALKFLLSEKALNAQAEQRFLKEAQAASSLDHPNICTIHEVGETPGGLLFICMAYYPGQDLGALLKTRSLEVPEALDIAIPVARGLAKAHENGIVHRDIKPANVIVTTAGEVKIVDFGLVKLVGGTQLTRTDSTMGTLAYMSPEQIKGSTIDHRTDIWSFGVLLYQALTGRLPFEGTYEAAVFYAIVNETAAPPSSVRSGIPLALDLIVARALEKRPQDRYASMDELLADLETVRSELSAERPDPPGTRVGTSGRRRDTDPSRREGTASQGQGRRSTTAIVATGKRHLQQREYAEALAQFEAALTIDPGNPGIRALYEQCARQLAETREADTLAHEAGTLLEKRRFKEAREVLLRATTMDPYHPLATQLLGKTEELLQRKENIEKLLLEADFYTRHEKYPEAQDRYQKVLDIDSTHKEALRGLRKISQARQARTDREINLSAPHRIRRPVRRGWIAGAAVLLVVAALATWYLVSGRTPTGSRQADAAAGADSSTIVASARDAMRSRQQEADKAGAATYAGATYTSARTTAAEAEQALADRKFTLAQKLFSDARSLFATSAAEAIRTSAAASSSIGALKDLVSLVRGEMESQKQAAERAGAQKDAPGSYRAALSEERHGVRLMGSSRKADLIAAHTAFTNARETYRRAAEDAGALATLRHEAETERSAMTAAKRGVQLSEAAKKASPSYQKAIEAESEAQRLLESVNLAGARDAYARAARLYADAGKASEAPGKTSADLNKTGDKSTATTGNADPSGQPPGHTERSEPAQTGATIAEADASGAAREAITRMLQTYKESIEKGDAQTLGSLLNLSDDKQRVWSNFFSLSQDRAVEIDGVRMNIGKDRAQVNFRARISYTASDKPASDEHPRVWTLEPDGNNWKVVTQK